MSFKKLPLVWLAALSLFVSLLVPVHSAATAQAAPEFDLVHLPNNSSQGWAIFDEGGVSKKRYLNTSCRTAIEDAGGSFRQVGWNEVSPHQRVYPNANADTPECDDIINSLGDSTNAAFDLVHLPNNSSQGWAIFDEGGVSKKRYLNFSCRTAIEQAGGVFRQVGWNEVSPHQRVYPNANADTTECDDIINSLGVNGPTSAVSSETALHAGSRYLLVDDESSSPTAKRYVLPANCATIFADIGYTFPTQPWGHVSAYNYHTQTPAGSLTCDELLSRSSVSSAVATGGLGNPAAPGSAAIRLPAGERRGVAFALRADVPHVFETFTNQFATYKAEIGRYAGQYGESYVPFWFSTVEADGRFEVPADVFATGTAYTYKVFARNTSLQVPGVWELLGEAHFYPVSNMAPGVDWTWPQDSDPENEGLDLDTTNFLSSGFGPRNIAGSDPIHSGIDLGYSGAEGGGDFIVGKPVFAVAGGRITHMEGRTDSSQSFGPATGLVINHGDHSTAYVHLTFWPTSFEQYIAGYLSNGDPAWDEIAIGPNVRQVGDWVNRGDIIGYVNDQGIHGRPHLHFEVYAQPIAASTAYWSVDHDTQAADPRFPLCETITWDEGFPARPGLPGGRSPFTTDPVFGFAVPRSVPTPQGQWGVGTFQDYCVNGTFDERV